MPPDQTTNNPIGDLPQVVERLRSANNVLVTISSSPTVDQFAACIGLTLVLNKLNKHANAVFSGSIPSTIEFLKPEQTIEKNTDSLRDFIIALDKSKADKLRYKVENDVVKIFITPYKTNISEADLDFSHGDFNVDAVVTLGVKDKSHLDAAILAHGRILHDAVVISVNNSPGSSIGTINWTDPQVSSLCEMVADVAKELSADVFDQQNATALLTGIVAETERYSNEKASPHTMSVAGALMSAGASTQLVSSKLEAPLEQPLPKIQQDTPSQEAVEPSQDDGTIKIDHKAPKDEQPSTPKEPALSEEDQKYDAASQILIDEHGQLKKIDGDLPAVDDAPKPPSRMINHPPSRGGRLTANDRQDEYSGIVDPLSRLAGPSILADNSPKISPARASGESADVKNSSTEFDEKNNLTLSDIERSIGSPHAEEAENTDDVPELELDQTRRAVDEAAGVAEIDSPLPKIRDDLSAQSFDDPPSSSPPPKVPPPPMIPPQ